MLNESKQTLKVKIYFLKDFIATCENIFENTKINLEKKWLSFKELFNKKNISRKECILLPFKTLSKTLKS